MEFIGHDQCVLYSRGAKALGNKKESSHLQPLRGNEWTEKKWYNWGKTSGRRWCPLWLLHLVFYTFCVILYYPSSNALFKLSKWLVWHWVVQLLFWPVCLLFILGNDTRLCGNLSGACVWERSGLRGLVSGSKPEGSAGDGLWPPCGQGRSRRSHLLQETKERAAAHAGLHGRLYWQWLRNLSEMVNQFTSAVTLCTVCMNYLNHHVVFLLGQFGFLKWRQQASTLSLHRGLFLQHLNLHCHLLVIFRAYLSAFFIYYLSWLCIPIKCVYTSLHGSVLGPSACPAITHHHTTHVQQMTERKDLPLMCQSNQVLQWCNSNTLDNKECLFFLVSNASMAKPEKKYELPEQHVCFCKLTDKWDLCPHYLQAVTHFTDCFWHHLHKYALHGKSDMYLVQEPSWTLIHRRTGQLWWFYSCKWSWPGRLFHAMKQLVWHL